LRNNASGEQKQARTGTSTQQKQARTGTSTPKDPRAGYQHGACLGGDYEVF